MAPRSRTQFPAKLIWRTILATLAILILSLAYTAQAHAIEVGMQDDSALLNPDLRNLALDQFGQAGGQWVRINVYHDRGEAPYPAIFGADTHATLDQYDAAVQAIQARGMRVQLTLTWYGQNDPTAYAPWAGAMARHFAQRGVTRFSILNEPDLTLVGAGDLCDQEAIRTVGQQLSQTYKVARLVRVPNRLIRKIRVHGKTRFVRKGTRRPFLVRRFLKAHGKTKVRYYRRSSRAGTEIWTTPDGQIVTARQGCFAIMRGRLYRQVALAAIPAIRAAAPGAQVLAGETSPCAGIEAFVRAVGTLHADGWAHHAYDDSEMGTNRIGELSQITGLLVYATEYGVGSSSPDRPGRVEAGIGRAIQQGAVEFVYYGWFSRQANWDTAIMRSADGSLTPEYQAFRAAATG